MALENPVLFPRRSHSTRCGSTQTARLERHLDSTSFQPEDRHSGWVDFMEGQGLEDRPGWVGFLSCVRQFVAELQGNALFIQQFGAIPIDDDAIIDDDLEYIWP